MNPGCHPLALILLLTAVALLLMGCSADQGIDPPEVTLIPSTFGGEMHTASRTSGVAPLAVFFDATDPASGVPQPPDGDHASWRYRWDFGDPDSGTFTTTGKSRNIAGAFCAAHVFDRPGQYRVTLTVAGPQGDATLFQQTVTATEFDGQSFYVSSTDGNDDWNGRSPTFEGGATGPLRSFAAGISMARSNTRILFKRGDSWAVEHGQTISVPGPGIIGAYGEGNRPTIHMDGTEPLLPLSDADDWRIMDLHLVGRTTGGQYSAIEGEALRRNLVLRTWISGFHTGIGHNYLRPQEHTENAVVDCLIESAELNNIFVGGQKLALLGNRITHSRESHLARIYHLNKGIISNNVFHNPGGDRLSLKLHNEHGLPQLPDSAYIVISENTFRGQNVVTAIGPQQEEPLIDERLHDILFEKNILYATPQTEGMAQFACSRVMIRNNIFVCTGSSAHMLFVVRVWRASAEPPPEHVRVYNNSAYMATDGDDFTFGLVTAGSDVIFRNNLAVTTAFTGENWQAFNNPAGAITEDNLLTRIQQYVDPGRGDFHLLPTAAARNAGSALPEVPEDFFANPRPQAGQCNLGAVQ